MKMGPLLRREICLTSRTTASGERKTGFLLQFLGTDAQELEPPAQAARASLGHCHAIVTLVADQLVPGKVMGKGNLAAFAAEDKAAATALNEGVPSPPIKEKNDLLTVSHGSGGSFGQGAAKKAAVSCLEFLS